MDEAPQARVHRREVVVAVDGIASVVVTLEDCAGDKPLVLATLSPPYSVIEFQPYAHDEANTAIQVERHETRRRVVIAAIRPHQFVGRRKLSWRFRVSNAYPFTLRDLIVPPENFYQTGAAEHAGRSCVLRISSNSLVQSIRFEQPNTPLAQPRAARTLIERQDDHWHGVGKQWVQEGAASANVTEHGTDMLARFESPSLGRRYGIVFKLDEVRATPAYEALSKEWHDAQRWIGRVCSMRSERSRPALKLQRQLTRAVHRQLCEQFEIKDLDCHVSWTSKGFVWDATSHTLRPTFGCFGVEDWGQEFPYGEGVVGHAFRFNAETTYDGEHNRTIICRRDDAAWIVCLPVRYRDTCVGVVSFAGTDRPEDAVGKRLLDLAKTKVVGQSAGTKHDDACQCSSCEHNRQLGSLTWRVNCAFWGTLAVSEFLSNAERRAAFDSLEQWRARDVAMSSGDSWPSIRQPTRTTPDKALDRAQPRTDSKARPNELVQHKARRRLSTKERVALITALFGVLTTLLTVSPKYWMLTNAKTATESAIHASTTPLTLEQFKASLADGTLADKLNNGSGLPELNNLDLRDKHFDNLDLSSARTFSHSNLTNAYLNDSVLTNLNLREAILVDTRLRHANLTNADLRDANLLNADIRGAILINARNLTDEQLSHACGDDQTQLSPGVFVTRTWNCR